MPGPTLSTDAFVLGTHPPTDKYFRVDLFSAEAGAIVAYQRLSRKGGTLDLFDHVRADLDATPQGEAWFVRDTRLLGKPEGMGRSYEALQHASLFARAVLANPVPDESRIPVYELIGQSLHSFGSGNRPDITLFKSLFVLIRDEGYPLRQHWLPTLSAPDQVKVKELLARPIKDQDAAATDVRRLLGRFVEYLQGHTEFRLPGMEEFACR
ncbi:MAG: hypothetical protein SFV32_00755 [Opitutaceae bacterium]|nr:hypothetical protein [Opitutaceae bacterium]